MTQPTFTPALGRFAHLRLYDPLIALTRERRWRGRVVQYLDVQADDIIVDVGCGTGTLALLLHQRQAKARIIGVDPDDNVLAIARQKAREAGPTLQWRVAMGNELCNEMDTALAPGSANKVTSSLVLHQCPVAMKRAILASMHTLLRPGGQLVLADYGEQRGLLMRTAFRIVQLADGKEDTQPNADGILPVLMREAGFADVRETDVIPTVSGSISVYVAERP